MIGYYQPAFLPAGLGRNMDKTAPTTQLLQTLSRQAEQSGKRLATNHPKAVDFLQAAGVTPGKIREHATKLLTSGALATTVFLTSPAMTQMFPSSSAQLATLTLEQREKFFRQDLAADLPPDVSSLTPEQEQNISALIAEYWGIDARASLQGERLNRSYGLIGAEQHLPRFPGDTIDQHEAFQSEGITPGLGAWGYFANSKTALTEDLIQKEKYYVAVQTLYLPDWNKRLSYLREWYKYRKVVVVNPINGKTIVCDIADSGPAQFTGKHFGGSPEVMAYLGLNTGMQKGPVILFFVNDSNNSLALGPVQANKSVVKSLAAL